MELLDMLLPRELGDVEILKGKILTKEQEDYLKMVFTQMVLNNSQVDLNPQAELRHHAELCRAHDAGKQSMIEELLRDSETAKVELNLLNTQQTN